MHNSVIPAKAGIQGWGSAVRSMPSTQYTVPHGRLFKGLPRGKIEMGLSPSPKSKAVHVTPSLNRDAAVRAVDASAGRWL